MNETRATESFSVHPALAAPGTAAVTGEVVRLDFGLADDKSRAIGGVIRIFSHVAFGGSSPRGAGWAATWSVTRDGADFGVGNRTIFGSSPGDVERAARRKLEASRARYLKRATCAS